MRIETEHLILRPYEIEDAVVVRGKFGRAFFVRVFIEIENGVDALLHVSQISRDHIEKPSDVLKAGQEITAKIVDFNLEDKKISLSIKALLPPKENETEGAAENTTGTEAAEESESVSAE